MTQPAENQMISILYPGKQKARFRSLSDTACHDLGLDTICEKLSQRPEEREMILTVLRTMTGDPDVSAFRIGIFQDICEHPKLRERMLELLDQIKFLNDYGSFKKTQTDSQTGLWDLLHRMDELSDYIRSVEAIRDCLDSSKIRSEGLLRLKAWIGMIYEDSLFEEMKRDIGSLHADTDSLKSITVGINLNSRFEVDSVGLISVNNKEFKSSPILGNVTRALSGKDRIREGTDWDGDMHYQPISRTSGEMSVTMGRLAALTVMLKQPLLGLALAPTIIRVPANDSGAYVTHYLDREMSRLLSTLTKKLERTVSKYISFSIYAITDLIPEFLYYVRWAEYIEKLKEKGFLFCTPQVLFGNADVTQEPDQTAAKDADMGVRMTAQGFYNLKLADAGELTMEEIVANDLDFSPEHTLYLLTGANRGGKTTLTQAIGLLYVLAQGGISVPASRFEFVPVDCVFTHYPADEDRTMDLGRLGEECRRFREIYLESTWQSLLLLNETFSTTSFEEGYYIARDAVKAILRKNVRTIYNTHMHKLAYEVEEFNRTALKGKAASLLAWSQDGVRSFHVRVAPPEGRSYARDIAEKYGVTYEMLTDEPGSPGNDST